jgi:sulfur carrier protein
MQVTINAQNFELPDGADLLDALRACGVDPARPGIAVAVNGTVVRRANWSATRLEAGAAVEVVTATQGG